MRIIKNIFKVLFFVFLVASISIFVLMFVVEKSLPNGFKLKIADELNINSPVPVTAVLNDVRYKDYTTKKAGDTYKVDLKMFGVIPFSSTTVEIVDDMYVAVLGNPFGMKLYTDGVLVTKIKSVTTENGEEKPAQKGGLKVGDYIKLVNGSIVTSNEDLSDLVVRSNGEKLKLSIIRNGKTKNIEIVPVLEKESNLFRVGIYVRDSSAGIGTLTFYSPTDNVICGLGHPVCDDDTSEEISLNSGEIVGAKILSYVKGEKGSPGELNGRFTLETISNDLQNCKNGVYGHLMGNVEVSSLTKVALNQEVKNGNAQILTTISGDTPKLYSCEIEICDNKSSTQNMIIKITDSELLEKTGGIIQGMSGSPILQNSKLIGAITHVFVDDPTGGYGIFAENMLQTSKEINSYKKAS